MVMTETLVEHVPAFIAEDEPQEEEQPKQKILVIRRDVHGDVLAATAVLPGLRRKYPDAEIHFQATKAYQWPLFNNPYIDSIVARPAKLSDYDEVFELDHHSRWTGPFAKVHCEICGVGFTKPELYFTHEELMQEGFPRGCIAVAHRAGWKNKWYERMDSVLGRLKNNYPNLTIVQVERAPRLQNIDIFAPDVFSDLRDIAASMKDMKLYLGVDTVFLHIAVALNKPMVCPMGSTTPDLVYMPHASWLQSLNRPPEVKPSELPSYGEPIDLDPNDVYDAVVERLLGQLTGKNPRVFYTDGEGKAWRP